jgi:uncharacterized protein YbaP (TraB family)
MRRFFLQGLRAIIGFCLGTAAAALSAQSLPAKPHCDDAGSTMLWQVEGPQLQARKVSVQLLGSIHVGKPEFYPLPTVVDQYFRAANTLVFEVDPRTTSSLETALSIQQRGMLPADRTLNQVVDVATMTSLRKVLQQLQLPEPLVSRMKPWMVTMLLTSLQVQALGFNPDNGVENYLLRAKPPAAQIAELESLDSQLNLLESMDQQTLLHYTLEDYTNTSAQMDSLITAWRCSDHAKLSSLLFASKDSQDPHLSASDQAKLDSLMKQLFDDRNKVMADKIEQFIKTGSGDYFVVVGAGHLLGDNSVVSQLQKKGFKVTPVRNKP